MARPARPSPILGAAAATIEAASEGLVTKVSPFRHTFEAPVAGIEPDPGQPRRIFDEMALEQLAATMNERGQLQPILLRRHPERHGVWLIVAGERRWRAAKLLGWRTVLAIEHDGDPEVAALLENLQRVDLTVVEEARGLKRLLEGKGWTQARAAEALGRSRAEISAVLRVLSLPEDLLGQVLTSELQLPRSTMVELARIEDAGQLRRLVGLAREGKLTVRALRAAKEQGAEPVAPLPAPARAVRFDAGVFDRMAKRLSQIRDSGISLTPADRDRLQKLRAEIDALLGGDRPTS